VDKSWGGELPFSVLYARNGRKAKVFSGKRTYAEYEAEVLKLLNPPGRKTARSVASEGQGVSGIGRSGAFCRENRVRDSWSGIC
jgi:hypothetical protein